FKASSTAGTLPAFGWVLLGAVLVTALVTGWLVHGWDKGQQAIEANKALTAERDAANRAYDALLDKATKREQQRVDDDLARQQALDRLDAIAAKLEQEHEANRKYFDSQRRELGELLDRRPDLRDLRLGDDVLQHWNRSNAGPAADGAAGAAQRPAGEPTPAVPGAAAGGERSRQRPAGQPRPGGTALRPVSSAQRIAAARAGRMVGHRQDLVLRRGGSGRPRRVGVPA